MYPTISVFGESSLYRSMSRPTEADRHGAMPPAVRSATLCSGMRGSFLRGFPAHSPWRAGGQGGHPDLRFTARATPRNTTSSSAASALPALLLLSDPNVDV